MHLAVAVVLVLLAIGGSAAARPLPPSWDDERSCEVRCRSLFEWSTWFRLGFGMADRRDDAIARGSEPPRGQETTWDAALGADVTLGIARRGNVRIGPWIEARGLRELVGGGEIVLTAVPRSIDMFFYRGEGILALRAGGNRDRVTAQIAYGYLAPWNLFRPQRGATRYMIGVRFAGSVTRSIDDPRDWSATVGLEVEPLGALRYLLGLRSLY